MGERTGAAVCRHCHLTDTGDGVGCWLAADGRHDLLPAPYPPGQPVRVLREVTEHRRGRQVTHVRAGAAGVVRGALLRSNGVWAVRVQVRSGQYWIDEPDLTPADAAGAGVAGRAGAPDGAAAPPRNESETKP